MPNPLEAFSRLSPVMKGVVLAAFGAVAIFAFIKLRSSQSQSVAGNSPVSPGGTVGNQTISDLLKGLGYDPSTTAAQAAGTAAASPAPAPSGNVQPTASAPPVAPSNPVPPSTLRYSDAQANANTAIAAWQTHTGQTWRGPSGSFPAGWGPTPQAPGAATFSRGNPFTWINPLPAKPAA